MPRSRVHLDRRLDASPLIASHSGTGGSPDSRRVSRDGKVGNDAVCDDRQVPAAAIRSPGRAAKSVLFWPGAISIGLASISSLGSRRGGFGGQSTLNVILELSAGWSILAAGYVLLRHSGRRAGLLFIAAGCAWFLLEWNAADSGSTFIFTTGLVCSAAARTRCPRGTRLSRWQVRGSFEQITVAAAYGVTVLFLGIGPALVFEPTDAGCVQCPRNLLVLRSAPRALRRPERARPAPRARDAAAVSLLARLAAHPREPVQPATRGAGPRRRARVHAPRGVGLRPQPGARKPRHRPVRHPPLASRKRSPSCALAAGVWWGRFRQRRARGGSPSSCSNSAAGLVEAASATRWPASSVTRSSSSPTCGRPAERASTRAASPRRSNHARDAA